MFCHINPRILFLIFVWPAVMIYLCLAQTLSNILPTFLFFISYNFTIRADAAASCRRVFRRSASVRFIRPLGHCRTSRLFHRYRTPSARLHPLPGGRCPAVAARPNQFFFWKTRTSHNIQNLHTFIKSTKKIRKNKHFCRKFCPFCAVTFV